MAEKNTAPANPVIQTAVESPPGLMSLTIFVPALVPLLFHGSQPPLAPCPRNQALPPMAEM